MIAWSYDEPCWLLSRSSTTAEVLPDFPGNLTSMYAVSVDLIYAGNICIKSRHGPGQGNLWGGVRKLGDQAEWEEILPPRDELASRAYAVGERSLLTLGDVHTTTFYDGTHWCSIDLPGATNLRDAQITPDHRLAYISGNGGTPLIGYLFLVELPVVP